MTISIKPTASGSTIEQDGSTILTVDGSGNIDVANDLTSTGNLYPKVPAFRAKVSADYTVSNLTWTRVLNDTEDFDTTNDYDNSTNYRFQPTVAGYYEVRANLYHRASTSLTRAITAFYKNGAEVNRTDLQIYNTTIGIINSVDIMYLNGSTDYVEAYSWTYGTGTLTILAGGGLSNFSANLVSV